MILPGLSGYQTPKKLTWEYQVYHEYQKTENHEWAEPPLNSKRLTFYGICKFASLQVLQVCKFASSQVLQVRKLASSQVLQVRKFRVFDTCYKDIMEM